MQRSVCIQRRQRAIELAARELQQAIALGNDVDRALDHLHTATVDRAAADRRLAVAALRRP
jgi:hypothetical protein